MLRAKMPEAKSDRLKLMMFSLAGVGKTTACTLSPAPYLIDTERGADKPEYLKAIKKAGGTYWGVKGGAGDMDEVITEVNSLLTTPNHGYKTLVIDSFTTLYEAKMDEGIDKVGDSYGKHIAYANRFASRLFRLLSLLDMNVIVTSHAKDEWEGGEKQGIKFDGWKKLDYLFDLVLELERRGKKRFAIVRKTRLAQFVDQEDFEWSYDALAERWGVKNLERDAVALTLATPEQVKDLNTKVKALNVPADTVARWLKKSGVDNYTDMPEETIAACIAWCDERIKGVAA